MKIKEIMISLVANTNGYDGKMQAAVKQSDALTTSKRELEQRLKSEQQQLSNLSQKYQQTTQSMGINSRKTKELKEEIERLKQSESNLKSQLSSANQGFATQTGEMNQTASAATNMKNSVSQLGNLLRAMITGYAGKKIFDVTIIDNAQMEQELTSFEVLLNGNVEKAKGLLKDLTDFAAKTPLQLPDTTKAAKMLMGYGVAAQDVVDKMGRLGDLSQGDAEKLDRVTLAYGQMLAKGKVTGEELRQMVEAQVPMLQALASYMGKTTAEVQDMISDSAVGIDVLDGAIKQMTDEGGQFYQMMEKQSQTMSGLWSTFMDNLKMAGRDIGSGAFEYLKGQLSDLMDYIQRISSDGTLKQWGIQIGSSLKQLFEVVVNLGKKLYELKDIILDLVLAFAGLKAAQMVFAAWQGGVSVVRILTSALGAATVAQTGLNTAMWANPAGLVIGALGLLAGTIAVMAVEYNGAKKSVEEYGQEIDALQDKEQSAIDKYNEYQALMAKSKTFGLNAEERERLLKLSEELVESYGLETSGIDELTGAYVIGTDAVKSYTEALRQQRLELEEEQTDERNKRIDKKTKELQTYISPEDAQYVIENAERYLESIKRYANGTFTEEDKKIQEYMRAKLRETGSEFDFNDYLADEDLNTLKSKLIQSTREYSNVVESVVRDMMDNIKVAARDALDQDSEDFLSGVLSDYLTKVSAADLNNEGWRTNLENAVTDFSEEYGTAMSEIQRNISAYQNKAASGNLDIWGYQKYAEELQKKLAVIKEMFERGIINQEEMDAQQNKINAAIKNSLGLSFSKISDGLQDKEIKGKFESVANKFLNMEKQFRSGSINIAQYMQDIGNAVKNLDFSETFGKTEEGIIAQAQTFKTLANQVTGSFDVLTTSVAAGEMNMRDYTDSLESTANTLSIMMDTLQANSGAWLENGESIEGSRAFYDDMQSDLAEGIETIKGYQDSIAALTQIMSGEVTEGTQQFTNNINVISDDLARIVAEGGYMADEIAAKMGTTTAQIASALTNNVDNQSLAAQAIAANTKTGIQQIATAVGRLIDGIAGAISKFKAEIKVTTDLKISGKFGYNEETGEITLPQISGGFKFSGNGSGGGSIYSDDEIVQTGHNKLNGYLAEGMPYEEAQSRSNSDMNAMRDKTFGSTVSDSIVNAFSGYVANPSMGLQPYSAPAAGATSGGNKTKSGGGSGNKGGGGSSGANDAEKAAKAARQEELDMLKWQRDMGLITEEEYFQKLADYRDKYFAEGTKEWRQFTLEIKKYRDGDMKRYLEETESNYKATGDLAQYINDLQWAINNYSMTEKEAMEIQEKISAGYKKMYDERLQDSKDWIAREKALGRMSENEEIEAGWRIMQYTKDAIAQIEQDATLSAKQKGDLTKELYKTLQNYSDKEIDLEKSKLDKIVQMNRDATEKIKNTISDRNTDSEKWIAEQLGRDQMTTSQQIAAYDTMIGRWKGDYDTAMASYAAELSPLIAERDKLLNEQGFDETSDRVRELNEQIRDIEKEQKEYSDSEQWRYSDMITKRYELYRDFLNQQVEDFVEAERRKVEAYYDSIEKQNAADDREKRRRELEEQIKQYEGAVTKEGIEKLKSLKEELASLNKEEESVKREEEKQAELDRLDALEKGMKDQVKIQAGLTIDNEQVANEIKGMIAEHDSLAKEWADTFTKPFADYFRDVLPKQIQEALKLPEFTIRFKPENIGTDKNVVTTNNNRNVTNYITVNANSNVDVIGVAKGWT